MSDLYVVRTEHVPIERLQEGDLLILVDGARVTVERVDVYDNGLIVRWWRPAMAGEVGSKGRRMRFGDLMDGRYLGSTMLLPAGSLLEVDRG